VRHRYPLSRREQRQHRTRRVSQNHRGTVHRVDDSAQILGLPLRCVRRGVTTVTPTATIVSNALQARLGERRSQRTGRLPVDSADYLGLEAVAHSCLGDEVARPSRIILELVSECLDILAQIVGLLHICRSPDFLK
jgi:hypothetical protein